jgi:hypothetical protein
MCFEKAGETLKLEDKVVILAWLQQPASKAAIP